MILFKNILNTCRRKMPLHITVAKRLKRGYSVTVEEKKYYPYESNLHKLNVGDWIICRLGNLLEQRKIQQVKLQNYISRFRVGIDTDIKKWVGKTKILGVAKNE
jgi:hypothetical protein